MEISLPETCSAAAVAGLWRSALPAVARLGRGDTLELDAGAVGSCGGAGEALIVELYRRSARQGFDIACRDGRGVVARTLELFAVGNFAEDPAMTHPPRKTATAEQVGEAVVGIWQNFCGQMAFLGEATVATATLLFRPRRLRLRDTLLHFERAGIDALPITLLIGFLFGLIVAFMAAATMRQFGVEVYVADLISIGLFRELGALITAIILAGRSGSAFAAEIGTMKVNEEVDALETLGLPPVTFLALPRVFAATLAMPLLTIFAIGAGLLGGAVVMAALGLPSTVYWNRIIKATTLNNVLLGLFKAAVFGLLVGLVGCAQGLQTGRTADAVGRAATAAVVGSLVLITIFDGLFAVLFHVLGI